MPAGTLTFLFTDIEGSTKLQTELGTTATGRARDAHAHPPRCLPKMAASRFRVEGDALLSSSRRREGHTGDRAPQQRALGTATFPHGATSACAWGCTREGRPATADAGADYVGIDVNERHASRPPANGGQVLLTEATATLARPDLGDGVSFRDLGELPPEGPCESGSASTSS